MPDPLKLSRDIAADLSGLELWSMKLAESDDRMAVDFTAAEPNELAPIIDAHVRPLVDALTRIELIARNYVQTGSDKQRPLFWEIHDIAKSALALSDPPEGDA